MVLEEIGLARAIKRINRTALVHKAGTTKANPNKTVMAPRVVAFVPVCRRLYTSGIRISPRLPKKRKKLPINMRI
jgi:hypothetical protein